MLERSEAYGALGYPNIQVLPRLLTRNARLIRTPSIVSDMCRTVSSFVYTGGLVTPNSQPLFGQQPTGPFHPICLP